MPSKDKLDSLYMNIADQVSKMSHARRTKVGAVLANESNILSYGWNGTPSGDDNNCEVENPDGTLITKHEVLHAESNSLMKLVSSGGNSSGATMYVTLSPCFECAKLIKQAKIKRVVFKEQYRDIRGIDFLTARGVEVVQLNNE